MVDVLPHEHGYCSYNVVTMSVKAKYGFCCNQMTAALAQSVVESLAGLASRSMILLDPATHIYSNGLGQPRHNITRIGVHQR